MENLSKKKNRKGRSLGMKADMLTIRCFLDGFYYFTGNEGFVHGYFYNVIRKACSKKYHSSPWLCDDSYVLYLLFFLLKENQLDRNVCGVDYSVTIFTITKINISYAVSRII